MSKKPSAESLSMNTSFSCDTMNNLKSRAHPVHHWVSLLHAEFPGFLDVVAAQIGAVGLEVIGATVVVIFGAVGFEFDGLVVIGKDGGVFGVGLGNRPVRVGIGVIGLEG